ncbi:unnamed protein product [Thlaspi arvense]|uniref:RRM domain-containing protein n=1 Tax=Thlaspi arvense TaxID=13288 RepID=A0AAU9SMZ6_THLAR|nr:unnamed protein product [Thlaspi arvense]
MGSSKKSKPNLLGKRKPEDDLATKPIPKRHKEKEITKEQLKGRVELLETKSDQAKPSLHASNKGRRVSCGYIEFASADEAKNVRVLEKKNDVGQVVRVRRLVNNPIKYRSSGYVEFASANEAKKALEKKKGEYLHDCQIFLDVANGTDRKYIPPVINFFEDVGQVVSVRLIVNEEGKHVGHCFVEFASTDEAKWALENKNGEYLHDHKILLMKGQDQTPDSVEHQFLQRCWTIKKSGKRVGKGFVEFTSANVAKKALEKKNGEYLLDCQIFLDVAKTNPRHNRRIFKRVGKVVRARLMVDHRGELVGCCFVEFSSADEAKKAVKRKDGGLVYVNMAEIAPYPFRRRRRVQLVQACKEALSFVIKSTLGEVFWCTWRDDKGYEDNLRREGLGLMNKPKLELKKPQAIFCGTKTVLAEEEALVC